MTELERAIFVFPTVSCVLGIKLEAPKFQKLRLDSCSVVDSEVRCNDGSMSLGSFSIALRRALCAVSFGRVSSFSFGTCMLIAVESDDEEG